MASKPDPFPEYNGLTLDDLYGERRSIGARMSAMGKEYRKLRIRNENLKLRIQQKRTGETGIGISDHAVLRYLERVKGVDVRAVRDEIRDRAALQRLDKRRDQIVKDGGTSFAVYDGERISTVWTDA